MKYFKLEGTKVVECDSLIEWAKFFESQRRVARTVIGPFVVSTVFLGLDHNFAEAGPPLIFETMVFSRITGGADLYMDRCSTYEQALMMHDRGVRACKEADIYKTLAREFRDRLARTVRIYYRDLRTGFVEGFTYVFKLFRR